MNLSQVVEAFDQENQSWLGSAHGTQSTRTVTLDISTFTEATHYPNGYLPSGIALGVVTASGKYGPYLDAATDGRQTLVGFLFTATEVPTGATYAAAALFDHGRVISAKLPLQTGAGSVDAAGQTDVAGRIWFV